MTWIYLVLIVVVIAFGIGGRRLESPAAPAGLDGGARRRLRRRRAPAPRPRCDRGPRAGSAGRGAAEAPPRRRGAPQPSATMRGRMARARAALAGVFTGVLGRSGITDETWDELEEALLRADVGVRRHQRAARRPAGAGQGEGDHRARGAARRSAQRDADPPRRRRPIAALRRRRRGSPNVWLFVGVNGVGKTTTIGKVANQQVADGRSVLLAAGDTFRAAAAEQLATWAVTGRGRAGAGQRGRRPERRRVRRHRAGGVAPRRPRARRHRRAPAHQDEPDGGAAQGAPGRREGRRDG